MNRYLSIDVLRGIIMIIMALDHVIGALAIHPATEVSFANNMFPGYISGIQQWSRLLTHLCAPGFQLLAGIGLAMSVARAQQAGTTSGKITSDLLNRAQVLILADLLLMLPVFRLPMFFMVLACIGSCTLCFVFLRFLPRHVIGFVGLAIILAAPLYKTDMMLPGAGQQLTSTSFLIDIWTRVGFGQGALGILYPILPWLGIFAIGWWIGLTLVQIPKDQNVNRSALSLSLAGVVLMLLGVGLRMSGWSVAEGIPLKGASLMDSTFWQFTKYPPSWVFISLTIGVLLILLGLFRWLLDRPSDQPSPIWTRIVAIYGRTALFYFVVHFYVIGLIAMKLGMTDPHAEKMSFEWAYFYWLVVLLIMFPLCFGYDKLRQRFRTVLRYF